MKRTVFAAPALAAALLLAPPAGAAEKAVDAPPAAKAGPESADPALRAVVAEVQKVYDGLEAFKVSFKQADELATLEKTKTASGSFWFRKPGKMRWEYEKPEKERKLIVVDGETAWIHVPAEKQVYKQKVTDAFQSQTLIAFLSGLGRLEDSFVIRFAEGGVPKSPDEDARLRLTPKTDAGAPEMEIVVRAKTREVSRVAFDDPFGNRTRIDFGPVQRGAAIPPDLFKFTPPADATVTDADQAR